VLVNGRSNWKKGGSRAARHERNRELICGGKKKLMGKKSYNFTIERTDHQKAESNRTSAKKEKHQAVLKKHIDAPERTGQGKGKWTVSSSDLENDA